MFQLICGSNVNKRFYTVTLFAFAFNAKNFTIAILVSFIFSPLVQSCSRIAKRFLANILKLVIKKAFDQDLTHSLDTPKNISVKAVPQVVIRDACGT